MSVAAPAPSPFPAVVIPAVAKPKDLWWVGAIINLAGSIMINLGTNIMKLGHNKRALLDMPEEQKPPIHKFKSWVIGMFLFSVGNVLNFVSFGFAAQSLLAALGSVQFVSNVIFARAVLHEEVTYLVVLATGCIVGGCVILVIFGNQSSDTYTVQQLIQLYSKPAYIVYLVLMGIFVLGGYITYIQGKKVLEKRPNATFWLFAVPISYATFSALLGTQSVLFSKSLSVLLRITFSGDSQLGFWYTWVVLPIFIFTAGFWVTRLNKGLRMFPAMLIVPIMQIAWTLFSIVSGMLYFQEYLGFTTLKAAMFPVGVVVVLTGVVMLTLGQRPPSKASAGTHEDGSEAPTVHENALFIRHPKEDTDKRSNMLDLDTLRFTSLATNTGPNIRDLIQAETARRKRKEALDLNATDATSNNDTMSAMQQGLHSSIRSSMPGHDHNPNHTGTSSMMSTVRKGLKNLQSRINTDFGFEGKSSMRSALGLGDGSTPAISLFAMPTMDMAGQRASQKGSKDTALALPNSRFYNVVDKSSGVLPNQSVELGTGMARRGSADVDVECGRGLAGTVQRSVDSDPTLQRSQSEDGGPTTSHLLRSHPTRSAAVGPGPSRLGGAGAAQALGQGSVTVQAAQQAGSPLAAGRMSLEQLRLAFLLAQREGYTAMDDNADEDAHLSVDEKTRLLKDVPSSDAAAGR